MDTFGSKIGHSIYKARRDVITGPEVSASGNIILRGGVELDDGSGRWERTAHIVLVPDEARKFAQQILDALGG
jgi:hypothetical protein